MIKYLGKSNTMKKGSIFVLDIDNHGEEGVAAGAPDWPDIALAVQKQRQDKEVGGTRL